MNLQQTKESLEQNNVQIALDIGVHQDCDINSNCPLAVDLRKIVRDSGTTLEQLIEGFLASQADPPAAMSYTFPEIDGKTSIHVAGQAIQLDLTDILKQQLGAAFESKINALKDVENRVSALGRELYNSYLLQIAELQRARNLPQLTFSTKELIKANCLITAMDGRYIFMFPRVYNPGWIVSRGVRYKLSDTDVTAIKRDIYLTFGISPEYKIIDKVVYNAGGNKFKHYHGSGYDCWGTVSIPERWDGRLQSLSNIVTQLMGSLATINRDSILNRHPAGMPEIEDIFGRSTLLGEEGIREEREQPAGRWTGEAEIATEEPARTWGGRTNA